MLTPFPNIPQAYLGLYSLCIFLLCLTKAFCKKRLSANQDKGCLKCHSRVHLSLVMHSVILRWMEDKCEYVSIGPPSFRVSWSPDCRNLKALDSSAAKSLKMELSFKIQIYHGTEWFQLCYSAIILLLSWNISGAFFFHVEMKENLKQLNPELMFPLTKKGHIPRPFNPSESDQGEIPYWIT